MLAAKSSLCGRIWTIQPSSGNPPPVRWNLTSQHRHKDTHTLLASFLWSPPTKYTSPPELQFIHTATGSRTVRQVVNKGHGFVLSTDKKENRGFFFFIILFCVPSACEQPSCRALQKLLWDSDRSEAQERLFDFIISTQTGKMTRNKENKMQIERRVEWAGGALRVLWWPELLDLYRRYNLRHQLAAIIFQHTRKVPGGCSRSPHSVKHARLHEGTLSL